MEQPFKPHANLADEVNRAIGDSELNGGVDLNQLAVGRGLYVYTKRGYYLIAHLEDGFYIKGHPFSGTDPLCPEQLTPVKVTGSVFSQEGSMIKSGWIGRGMFLEFHVNNGPRLLSSTPILEITEY